jgi:hypothetical protein
MKSITETFEHPVPIGDGSPQEMFNKFDSDIPSYKLK